MLRGSIAADEDEKEYLESLGIVVGIYNRIEKEFADCLVSDEAMAKLDEHWGAFFWSLFPLEKSK